MRRGAPARRPATPIASGSEAPGELAVRAWVRILAVQKHALAAILDELEREMTMPRFDLLAILGLGACLDQDAFGLAVPAKGE